MSDHRRSSPATARNREPLLAVLREALPATGTVLEIASGAGEHALFFARELPGLVFQPSDPDPEARASIAAWIADAELPNVRAPLDVDVRLRPWPIARADAVLCVNMLHIAPWEACEALFAGAAEIVTGPIVTYGPYRVGGAHTAPSNEAFDASLRARDPAWGIRDLEAVAQVAAAVGFELAQRIAMPANNFTLVFRRP